jgi:hypothetical protein
LRFPSIAQLTDRARAVLGRFPWTMAAGVLAAAFAIAATYLDEPGDLVRAAMVAALGLPATIALTLLAEQRRWPAALRIGAQLAAVLALVAFHFAWPGADQKHDALRYFQLSAVLHLSVAFLPWLGTAESPGFWQYNRRLFLGFLRAGVFSAVLYVGTIVAIAALDQLFGVDVDDEIFVRIWFVAAFVVNTWIFLASVPADLPALDRETDYPRALKVFAQYILTPLAFSYLLILLAYLVKLVTGAEWPSGWIGWLVTSVAVTGILGFLLVYPLRNDPGEGWIRTYTRWLFIGLVPASVMLLAAFWKRIVPYGMTEPRVLGVVLGLWLLAISLGYALRPGAGIRRIPLTLALVLLVMLYGPLSPSAISVASQRDRLAKTLPTARENREDAREASGALRFLIEHRAEDDVAAAIGREVPPAAWDSVEGRWQWTDSVGTRIMAIAGAPYVPRHEARMIEEGTFELSASREAPRSVTGFDWIVELSGRDTVVPLAGADTLHSRLDTLSGVLRITTSRDTFDFDLDPLVRLRGDSASAEVSPALLQTDAMNGGAARLALSSLGGRLDGDSASVRRWGGMLLMRGRE